MKCKRWKVYKLTNTTLARNLCINQEGSDLRRWRSVGEAWEGVVRTNCGGPVRPGEAGHRSLSTLINCPVPSRVQCTEGAKTRPPEPCQRGKKSVSDRPLAGESIILIEGGAAIGQRPPRPFIYYRHCDAAAGPKPHTSPTVLISFNFNFLPLIHSWLILCTRIICHENQTYF